MTLTAADLNGLKFKGVDEEKMKEIKSSLIYGTGFPTYCEIGAEAEKIYDNTADLEPHVRLGKITDFFYESLMNKEGMSDKKKSEILALAIEVGRRRLGLFHDDS